MIATMIARTVSVSKQGLPQVLTTLPVGGFKSIFLLCRQELRAKPQPVATV